MASPGADSGLASTMALDLRRDLRTELFANIKSETATLKRRQKKASAYEYRQDASKLPTIGHMTVDLSSIDPSLLENACAAIAAPMHAPASPAPGSSEAARPASASAAAGEASGMAALDAYDPKEAAAKELEAIRQDIIAKRGEASSLRLELDRAVAVLETTRTDLHQARFENNLAEQRKKGVAELRKAEQQLVAMTTANDKAAMYQLTLQRMIERMRNDKVGNTKNMRLLEDALRVQQNELKLQRRLLRQAVAAKDTEDSNLKALMEQQRTMKRDLDMKLEGRAQEVAIRQARKAERDKRMAEEVTLLARVEGDLTAKEEQELKRRAAKMKAEAKMAAQRLRFAMMKADALEEEFNRVRMTAGATDASDGVEAGASATLQEQQHDPKALRFRPPNPKQVIHRFEVMQEEVGDADRQIADLSRRITHLSRAKTELGKALQPTAMDPVEETTFSREDRAMLENQSSLCRRELESQRLELERLKRLKVFLGQALGSIFARLQHISPDAPVGVRKPLPTVSNWARTVYSKLQETVERLLFVREEIDRSQAKPSRSGHNGLLVDPSVDDSEHFSKSKHFEATIESVVTTNEMGIRIPTMSNTASRRELVPKDFRSATQQFSSAHSRAQKDSRSHSSSGGSTDEVPALGMLSKQRPKSSRLGTARASAAAAREAQDGKRKAPKATEVTRFLAAAVSQTGQAVHEDILASLNDEPDEAPDRSRIKSNSHHEMQSYASLASMPTGK